MSIFDLLSRRLLVGMMHEEQNWNIHVDYDVGMCTVTDIPRGFRSAPSANIAKMKFENYVVERFTGDSALNDAKEYVRWRVVRYGLAYAFQVWRTDP